MPALPKQKPVLVAGATGFIGVRLIPRLLEQGFRVRALARNPAKVSSRPWAIHPELEIVKADLLDPASLNQACEGCSAVYYLVHSMNPGNKDFAHTDRDAANFMVAAAEAAGIERIIYLGGLGEENEKLSEHLRSRTEVAQILCSSKIPVTVLRAAMIIGSGSASFEILRYLVERLPIMITPRWVNTPSQPIGIRNVLHYLIACLDCPETIGETFDIGQEEIVTYRQLMEIFAEEAGLAKRLIIPVPVLTPHLSSLWIHLVTPVPAVLARPLAEGLSNEVICHDTRIRELIPQELFDCRKAIRLALERTHGHQVESSWTDSGAIPPAEWATGEDPLWAGGTRFVDAREALLPATADELWQVITHIGGETGWYYGNWLWKVRGFMDRMIGGVGLRRGRRSPTDLHPGDALDFWRVSHLKEPVFLQLVAEMKMPGEAVLEFHLEENANKETKLQLRALFLPHGILGILYWYAVCPFHALVFNGMLSGIAKSLDKPILKGPEKTK
jgi:uncharacterized protein YbjT (DUF2867 family)